MKTQHATPAAVLAARLRAHHTQRQAAALLGVTVRTWQHWEHGTVPVRLERLALYRLAAGIDSARHDRESAFLGPPITPS